MTFTKNLPQGWAIGVSLYNYNTYFAYVIAHDVVVAKGSCKINYANSQQYIVPGSIAIDSYVADSPAAISKINAVLADFAKQDAEDLKQAQAEETRRAVELAKERAKLAIEAVLR